MTAEQARTIAYERNVSATDSQYAQIKTKITTAAKQGLYDTTIAGSIIKDVEKKLRAEGYNLIRVESDNWRSDSEEYTKISWAV